MSTHFAISTATPRGKLQEIQVPTITPGTSEVRIRSEWTASTPLDLHLNDGWIMGPDTTILGDSTAGTVVEVGPNVKNLKVGDKVFGFVWRTQIEKGHQEFITLPEFLLGKVPKGFALQQAVTLPNNFVTVFHSVTADLGLPLSWPIPSSPPEHADSPFLIWGASSSVGQYALQILAAYGYRNLIATASPAHHALLKSFGARTVVDYRSPEVVSQVLAAAKTSNSAGPAVPFILDCIGSKSGSLAPCAELAQRGAKVAVLLPVIVKDASETEAPEYSMDVLSSANWADGVEARGVRTHFYLENEMFKEKLQPEIMPWFLAQEKVKPNRFRIVEGETSLERAQKALDTLRRKEVSGERLVWKVAN